MTPSYFKANFDWSRIVGNGATELGIDKQASICSIRDTERTRHIDQASVL
ncbi:MAG: hypothetical protein H3C43_00835 [Leptonema sp. (in: Bacteria)]|nr:hypothetical protein [Leptonema sp. (in: bacteria)]